MMLPILRKFRGLAWTWQILLGDLIALANGRFISRHFRKKMHKMAGQTVNRFKPWKPNS